MVNGKFEKILYRINGVSDKVDEKLENNKIKMQ